MAKSKQWWQSRTIWVNVVLFLIAVVGIFMDQQVLDPKTLAIVSSILNVVLRFITHDPIK